MTHIDKTLYLFCLVYELTGTHAEDAQFSPQMVLVVLKNFKCLWCGFVWSDQSELLALFVAFNLWIGLGLILSSRTLKLTLQ
jgi:hypothetical protein